MPRTKSKLTWQEVLDAILTMAALIIILIAIHEATEASVRTIGSAPWCTFDGFTKNCLYYDVRACNNAAEALNCACVPK